MTDKSLVLDTIRKLSEEATLAEIIETLSILEAIRRGDQAVAEGRIIPHAEVKARLAAWAMKSSGPSRLSPTSTRS